MRYPAEHKQQTRAHRPSRRPPLSESRREGAVSDLMRDLRLMHGGFYRHFDSKEDLFAERSRMVSSRWRAVGSGCRGSAGGGELKHASEVVGRTWSQSLENVDIA